MSSGAQMLTGGLLLTLASAALGEFHSFHPSTVSRGAWLALLYLIVFGSIIGFTAYVWLIHHESPTKVGTYAYVNPVVAVLVGYFLGGEALGMRAILGTLCVLVSVLVITTTRAKKPAETLARKIRHSPCQIEPRSATYLGGSSFVPRRSAGLLMYRRRPHHDLEVFHRSPRRPTLREKRLWSMDDPQGRVPRRRGTSSASGQARVSRGDRLPRRRDIY